MIRESLGALQAIFETRTLAIDSLQIGEYKLEETKKNQMHVCGLLNSNISSFSSSPNQEEMHSTLHMHCCPKE